MVARRLLVVVVACLASAATVAEAIPLSARSTRGYDFSLVRVVQPISHQPFFGSLHIVLAIKPGTRITRADLSGRSFARYLQRASATRMVATVPRSLIGTGPRALRITATSANGRRRDHELLPLLAALPKSSVLTVSAHRVGNGAGAADITAVTHPRTAALRLWVNGHRVDELAPRSGMGKHMIRVTAADGLRLGSNTITAIAHDGARYADREVHVVTEPRSGPLPGLVYTRRAQSHGIALLDARKTLRLHSGDHVTFSWSVVSAPSGSTRRLTSRTGARVRLLPDKPGHYQIRLRVRELVPVTKPKRPATESESKVGFIARVVARTSVVTIPLNVTMQMSAFGAKLETLTNATGGIAYSGVETVAAPGGGAITLMAIDRLTGEPLPCPCTVPGANGAPDIETLAHDISNLQGPLAQTYSGQQELIVLIGQQSTKSPLLTNTSAMAALENALSAIGVDQGELQHDAEALANGQPFTVVGSPEYAPSTAYANFDSTADGGGSLSGYVRDIGRLLGDKSSLDFQPSQLLSFHAGPSGAQFDTPAGGQISIPAPPSGGFSISVLDAHSLRLIGTVNSGTGPGQSVGSISNTSTPLGFMNEYVTDPTKLILLLWNGYTVNYSDRANFYRFLGDPQNGNRGQDGTPSNGLTSIGVNRDLLIRSLQPSSPADTTYEGRVFNNQPYTFLGGSGVTSIDGSPLKLVDAQKPGLANCPANVPNMSDPTTGQQCVRVSGANVSGFLADDGHGRLEPRSAESTPQPGLVPALTQLANASPIQYAYPSSPAGTTAQYAAAESRLFDLTAAAVSFCGKPTECGIVQGAMRANYETADFTSKIDAVVKALGCPQIGQTGTMPSQFYDNSPSYTEAQLAALWSQVCGEVTSIQSVHENTFQPIECAMGGGGVCPNQNSLLEATLDGINQTSTITGFVDQTAKVPGLNVVDLLSRIAEFAGVVADLAGEPDIGEPLAFVSSGLGIGAEFANEPKSSDTNGQLDQAEGAMASWLGSNGQATANALTELEGIMYSDPNKLSTAFVKESSGGPWNLSSPGQINLMSNTIVSADASYIYPHLLGAGNSNSCGTIWGSSSPNLFQPGWGFPASPGQALITVNNPLTYFAWVNPMEAVDQNNNHIPFSFGAEIEALKLSSTNATTLAQALFQAPTLGELDGSDNSPPTPGGLPLGSLNRSDLSLKLQNPANAYNCQGQYNYVTNGP